MYTYLHIYSRPEIDEDYCAQYRIGKKPQKRVKAILRPKTSYRLGVR